jgi:murein L,D-transpeptidase YafK
MRGGPYWLAGVIGISGVCAATTAWPSHARDSQVPVIHIRKARHEMWLQEGDRILRKFRVALGTNSTARKLLRGDHRTPEGHYYICEKRPQSRFHRFLGISYPNVDDAERAFAAHLISADDWAALFFATLRRTTPPSQTALGGHVGIHGYGGHEPVPFDWTAGCIAVSDADIDYLYDHVPIGTRVIISD